LAASLSGTTRYILCRSNDAGYSALLIHTTNWGLVRRRVTRLVDVPLPFDFFFSNAMRLVPREFSPADATVTQPHQGPALELAPTAPYSRRSRDKSRIAAPTAMLGTCVISPMISKFIHPDYGTPKHRSPPEDGRTASSCSSTANQVRAMIGYLALLQAATFCV
jgi:hypothetical protein